MAKKFYTEVLDGNGNPTGVLVPVYIAGEDLPGTGAGGSPQQVQVNVAGVLAGFPGFAYDPATGKLIVTKVNEDGTRTANLSGPNYAGHFTQAEFTAIFGSVTEAGNFERAGVDHFQAILASPTFAAKLTGNMNTVTICDGVVGVKVEGGGRTITVGPDGVTVAGGGRTVEIGNAGVTVTGNNRSVTLTEDGVSYAAANATDWGGTPPTTDREALDRLAARPVYTP